MPRALWSGAISFGLVNAPVRMYTAISEHNVHFNLVHAKSAERIHYRKVAGSSAREVKDDQIVKGYEVAEGEYVTLTDEEIAAAHVEGDKVIEIHDFVPLDEIDPIVFERTYYLGPAEGSERVYGLLAKALETTGLVGIASFVFHDRDQLACLRVKDGGLLLERMYFADEVRDPDGVLPDRKRAVDKRELKLAVDLIERMQGTFDHSAYHDRYRERLDGDHRQEAQGRDDQRARGRGAARAGRSHGRARGEPRRGRREDQGREEAPGDGCPGGAQAGQEEGRAEAEEGRSQGRRHHVTVGASPLRRTSRAPWRASMTFVLGELALWLLLYPLYLLTREGAEGSPAAALRHAREIVAAERSLGLAFEHGLQQIATASPITRAAFDTYYEWAFYPLLAVVVIWLGLAHRNVYRHTRRALVVALVLAAICFLLFPTAPPRMVPGLGIHDTVGMHDHDVGSFHGISYNPYAAMPSLHVGWSLIAAAGVFRAVRSRWVRAAAIVHPLAMTVTTIATGNHYLLDCMAGAAIGLLALAATGAPRTSAAWAPPQVGVAAAAGRHA